MAINLEDERGINPETYGETVLSCAPRDLSYLARVRLLLGVHAHVREQFVLGVERRQLAGAVL